MAGPGAAMATEWVRPDWKHCSIYVAVAPSNGIREHGIRERLPTTARPDHDRVVPRSITYGKSGACLSLPFPGL